MADLGWIVVNRWEDFQTYDTKRGQGPPPWIKVYTRLLHDDAYLDLTGDQRAVLHGLWLEYASSTSRHRLDDVSAPPRLRADTRSLTRRLNLRVTSAQLKVLEQAGYIRLVAFKASAEQARLARTSRTREEVEVEVEKTSSYQSGSKTTAEESAEHHVPDAPPGSDEESNKEHEHERELVRFSDDNGMSPVADVIEELQEKWSA